MTWAKVDDTLHSHRKRRAAGFEALGLWVVAMSYCAGQLTDGRLTEDDVVELCRGNRRQAVKLATALVDSGLWERADDGYTFHDWHHYQPTRAHVLAERARKAEAGRKGGVASGVAKQAAKHPATAPSQATGEPYPGRSHPIPVDPADRAHARGSGPGPEPGGPPAPAVAAENAAKLAELAHLFAPKAMP